MYQTLLWKKLMRKVHFIKRKLDFDAKTMDNLVNSFIGEGNRILECVQLTNDYIIVLYKDCSFLSV